MKRLLLIRRDNIGDLVLTTPLIHALRERFPDARIDVLTNSYCAPVLDDNPDVDNIHIYAKAHHRGERSVFGVYLDRIKLILRLRRTRYDCIVLGKPQLERRPLAMARQVGSPMVVGVAEPGEKGIEHLTHALRWRPDVGLHVVERCMQLMEAFGERPEPGPLRMFPKAYRIANAKKVFARNLPGDGPLVAVQISARKIKQRWPLERYAEFMRRLHTEHGARFALFWSPGSENNPMHPGDDEKTEALIDMLGDDVPLQAFETQTIGDLVAALSATDFMVTSDGGALHLGVAAGCPTLCFFGNSEASR